MKGFPKTLNTKFDYEYVRNNFPAEEYKPVFQALLDTSKEWFSVDVLNSKEDGIEDDTHKIIEAMDTDGNPTFTQFEYRVNEDAKIFELGYTTEEVEQILAE